MTLFVQSSIGPVFGLYWRQLIIQRKHVYSTSFQDAVIFPGVLFSRNFAFAKFRVSKILAKLQNHSIRTDMP